jgi:CheY-like chemotaxis protein
MPLALPSAVVRARDVSDAGAGLRALLFPQLSGLRVHRVKDSGGAVGIFRTVGGLMIRVLVAEDMRILRDTLVSVLNLEDDIKVVAQVATGTDIVPAALAERPDLAVLDIDLPGLDGITAASRLRERLPACRVVILTVSRSKTRLGQVTCGSCGRQAACVYSLIRPLRMGFRRIRSMPRSVMAARGASRPASGTRWAMPWCGRAEL